VSIRAPVTTSSAVVPATVSFQIVKADVIGTASTTTTGSERQSHH